MSRRRFMSPAALTLMFPGLFADKPLLGGYKPPCGGQKAKHDQLVFSAVAATFLYLQESGLARLELRKEGFLLKRNRVYVHPLSSDAARVSYLTRSLSEQRDGGAKISYLISEPVKVPSPAKYLVKRVWEADGVGSVDCRALGELRPYAEGLRAMLEKYKGSELYKAIKRETSKALESMREEMEDDDDDYLYVTGSD